MQVPTINEAVNAGEAYLAVLRQGIWSVWNRGQLRQICDEEDEAEVDALQPAPSPTPQIGEILQAILTGLTAPEVAKRSSSH